MTTDYNKIASEYQRAKQQPWREFIECYTLFRLIGDLTGKSVLDLACGEGYYTRRLRQHGAGQVVGVDLSEGMIDLARQEESREPLGIEYRVGDAKDVALPDSFDLVVAGYLLNYASSGEELLGMCQAIARALKPGGRFVTVNSNPMHLPEWFPEVRKYGFTKTLHGEFKDGAPIVWKFFLVDKEFEITNYQLSVPTHEWAFRTAGLRDVRWHPAQLAPAGEVEFGHPFWTDFLERPPITFIECVK